MYLGPIKIIWGSGLYLAWLGGGLKEEVGGRRVFEKIRDEAERGLTGRGTRGRSKQEQKRGNVCINMLKGNRMIISPHPLNQDD